jgi:hypothetical protein
MRGEIQKALEDIEHPEVREALKLFSAEGRPFALPSFKKQNRASAIQRKSDLIGGFPFTTASYPWPVSPVNGLHMQPIVQIDLDRAGTLLGFDFGSGLLQLWGLVFEGDQSPDLFEIVFSSSYEKGVMTRVIPKDALSDAPDNFYPTHAPWLKAGSEVEGVFLSPNKKMALGSIIEWQLADGLMYPIPIYEMVSGSLTSADRGVDELELFDEMEAAVRYCLTTPQSHSCYLGGVRGYGTGRHEDPAQGYPILFSIDGNVNVSIIFDDPVQIEPIREVGEASEVIHFQRERRVRAVFCSL